jgi:hypothetical protein
MRDARSVCELGWRHVLERRLAAARCRPAELQPGACARSRAYARSGAADFSSATAGQLRDARSILGDGRRNLLGRRLAAPGHRAAQLNTRAAGGSTSLAVDASAEPSDSGAGAAKRR